MDKIRVYTYAFGSGEELRAGNFEDLETSDKPEKLAGKLRRKSNLILPRFLGVYQGYQIVSNGRSEAEHIGAAQESLDGLAGLINEISVSSVLGKRGILDRTHPDLIHVGYAGDSWNEELVRQSISDETRRVAVSRVQELPAFYGKDDSPFVNISRIGAQLNFPVSIEELRELKELIGKDLIDAKEQRRVYGLTLMEEALLDVARRIYDGPSRLQHPLEFLKGLVSM